MSLFRQGETLAVRKGGDGRGVRARTPLAFRDRPAADRGRRYAPGLLMSLPESDFESTLRLVSAEVEALQSALRAALESVLPESTGARACGRALGLTRFLGWATWNLAYAPDVPAAIRSLPGIRGWKSILAALRKHGCPDGRVSTLEKASASVTEIFSKRKISVTLLRSIAVGGLDTERDATRIRSARRDARAAAETLLGVRASLNAVASIVGPPDPDGFVDMASLSLFAGLERLRPGPAWPIFRWSYINREGRGASPQRAAIEPGAKLPLVARLSSPGLDAAELRLVEHERHPIFEFLAPRPGRIGGLQAAFGEWTRHGGQILPTETRTDICLVATIPTRTAILDLFLHRDVPFVGEAAAGLYTAPDPMGVARMREGDQHLVESGRLPLEVEATTPAGTGLPARWKSCDAAWRALVDRGFRAIRGRPADFRHIRIEVPDPPLHGSVALRWRLR